MTTIASTIVTPEQMSKYSNHVAYGIFASASSGHIKVWTSSLDYMNGKLTLATGQLSPNATGIQASGYQEYSEEYFENKTARAIEYHNKAKSRALDNSPNDWDAYDLEGLVEAVIDWSNSNEVARPVDLLTLTPEHGIQWIEHKKTCRITNADDFKDMIEGKPDHPSVPAK